MGFSRTGLLSLSPSRASFSGLFSLFFDLIRSIGLRNRCSCGSRKKYYCCDQEVLNWISLSGQWVLSFGKPCLCPTKDEKTRIKANHAWLIRASDEWFIEGRTLDCVHLRCSVLNRGYISLDGKSSQNVTVALILFTWLLWFHLGLMGRFVVRAVVVRATVS